MAKIVKYDNKMNSLNFERFTSNDFDFFFGICHEMQGKGTTEVILTFSQIAELVQYKETDKKRFIQDIERMYDKVEAIQYRYEDSKEIVKFRLFGKFKLYKEKEEVAIRIDEEFVSLLNDLTEQFTLFELKQFIALSGKHTKTLFRLCKQWRISGKTQVYSIEELKKIFDCENYENRDFTKLLKKAMNELKEKEYFKDLKAQPKTAKKRGSPVIAYTFTFEAEQVKKKPVTNYTIEQHRKKGAEQEERNYIKQEPVEPKEHSEISFNNVPVATPKTNNRFCQFTQREYSKEHYAELERRLIRRN